MEIKNLIEKALDSRDINNILIIRLYNYIQEEDYSDDEKKEIKKYLEENKNELSPFFIALLKTSNSDILNLDNMREFVDKKCSYAMVAYTGIKTNFNKKKITKELFELLNESMNIGNIKAITKIGICYEEGWYVKKDEAKALTYFEQADKLGDTEATYFVGVNYLKKWDAKNNKIGLDYYKKAYTNGFITHISRYPRKDVWTHICLEKIIELEKSLEIRNKIAYRRAIKGEMRIEDAIIESYI